jgi:alkanesulfonate monooxygenase SsuD/methylene tetrahydromethanopterin reductase-like flavin-dependent oxidoreductase (luciferase family)
MRSSNKSRSRNKNRNRNNNNNNPANVVNRVFDSSGPEGKVRGTPQQVIDKYQTLARDAQLSGDRVAHENFLQHAEHYVRLLGDAQREIDVRREHQDAQRLQNQQNQNNQQNRTQSKEIPIEALSEQPTFPTDTDVFHTLQDGTNLVETPESKPEKVTKKPTLRKHKQNQKVASPADIVAEAAENMDDTQNTIE